MEPETAPVVLDFGSFGTSYFISRPEYTFTTLKNSALSTSPYVEGAIPFLEFGAIVDWHAMNLFLDLLLESQHLTINTKPSITILEDYNSPVHAKIDLAQRLFDPKYGIADLCFISKPLAILHSRNASRGIVVDCGHSTTTVCAVVGNQVVNDSNIFLELGGKDITSYLSSALIEKGYYVTALDLDQMTALKHTKAKVSESYDNIISEEVHDMFTKQQTTIQLGHEIFACAEVLFRPSLVQKSCMGIHEAIKQCIKQTDGLTEEFPIILTGNSSYLPGLSDRLSAIFSQTIDFAPVNQDLLDGEALRTASTCKITTRKEFEEFGTSAIGFVTKKSARNAM